MSVSLINIINEFKSTRKAIKKNINLLDEQIKLLTKEIKSVNNKVDSFNKYFEENKSSITKEDLTNITENFQPHLYGITCDIIHNICIRDQLTKECDKFQNIQDKYESIRDKYIGSISLKENINKFENCVKELTDVYINTPYGYREKAINSMYEDQYYHDVCGDAGSILYTIKKTLFKYNGETKDWGDIREVLEDYLKESLTSYIRGEKASFNEIKKDITIDKIELKIKMLEEFKEDFLYHTEIVSKGYSCEQEYIESQCKACSEIFDNYTHTEPCKTCGKVWWSSS